MDLKDDSQEEPEQYDLGFKKLYQDSPDFVDKSGWITMIYKDRYAQTLAA